MPRLDKKLHTTATSKFDNICLAYSNTIARHNTTLAQHLEARQCKNLQQQITAWLQHFRSNQLISEEKQNYMQQLKHS